MANSVRRPLPNDLAEHIRARQRLERFAQASYPAASQFQIRELEAWAVDGPDDGAAGLWNGEYLETMLTRLGWWIGAVDLSLAGSGDLPKLRSLFAEVCASIAPAWGESYTHSSGSFAVPRARKLIGKYCAFRCAVLAAIVAAWPGTDLSELKKLT